MRSFTIGLVALALAQCATAQETYDRLIAEWRRTRGTWLADWKKTESEPAGTAEVTLLPKFVAAATRARDSSAVPLLCWIVLHDPTPGATAAKDALDRLTRYGRDRRLAELVRALPARAKHIGRRSTLRCLDRLLANPRGANDETLHLAMFARARTRRGESAESRRDFERVRAFFDRKRPPRIVHAGKMRVEIYDDRVHFEARLAGRVRSIGFDDIQAPATHPVEFRRDRYLATHGVRIEGTRGQFVDRWFEFPDDFIPASAPNMYAPGPVAPRNSPGGSGGHETSVTFSADGRNAATSAFGLSFLDADHPNVAKSGLRVYAGKRLLVEDSTVKTQHGGAAFRGIVVSRSEGGVIPAITRVVIKNGNEWPAVDGGEGVALDDFTLSPPVANDK